MAAKTSRRREPRCACGSGLAWSKCNPEAGLVACADCGKPLHPASNRHRYCGTAVPPTGCAGERRLDQERKRKRAVRAAKRREREQRRAAILAAVEQVDDVGIVVEALREGARRAGVELVELDPRLLV